MSHNPFAHSSAPTSAYIRHKQAVSAHLNIYNGQTPRPAPIRTERHILEETHRFIRDGEDEDAPAKHNDEEALAKKYYSKLYREFALVELSRWREGLLALRWRTKDEVVRGKGEEICAGLGCHRDGELETFELNFGYVEHGEKRNALVKVRVCGRCARKVREIERVKNGGKGEGKRRRSESPRRGDERREKRRRERPMDGGYRKDRDSGKKSITRGLGVKDGTDDDRAHEDQHRRDKHRSRHHRDSSSKSRSRSKTP